jgi:hypothetical protein
MSQLIVDRKYAAMISNRLRNAQFKGGGNVILSFSHHCERADSRKRRGYLLTHSGKVFFRCHHCGASCSLGNFIKELDPNLASEYRLELFKAGVFRAPPQEIVQNAQEAVEPKKASFQGLINYAELAKSNPARQYLERRQIPEACIDLFYLAPKFYSWAAQYESSFVKF